MSQLYTCCDESRRAAVDAHATLNGIDWLEVLDLDAPAGSPRQRTLLVRLLKPVPAGLGREQVRIEGGERVRPVRVEWAAPATAPPAAETTAAEQAFFAALEAPERVLLVRTDAAGDYSTYRLRLVRGEGDDRPPPGLDPCLVTIDFSFKVECPSDFDCEPVRICPEPPEPAPDIDYLAKDYASFRRLMLDRLSRLVPGWRERSAADLAVTLAELLAYAGDHLSYWQDAIGTEAYLATARRRASLRRLALLVDYPVGEGCNARAWVQVRVADGPVDLDPATVRFYTRAPGAPPRIAPGSREEAEALAAGPLVFEPMHGATLREEHDELRFHTWGDRRCCLPKGATRATLRGHHPHLAPGDVLVLREALGPLTGRPEDADPAHRHPVRLIRARAFDGAAPLADPLDGQPITEIAWHAGDALPFPLCISAETDAEHGATLVDDVSLAHGNVVLADHGRTIEDEPLGAVPPPRLHHPPERDADPCEPPRREPLPPRYRPGLAQGPLTRTGTVVRTRSGDGPAVLERAAFDPDAPAAQAVRWAIADVVPAVIVHGADPLDPPWEARRDLLDSQAADHHFVVEPDLHDRVRLRFGDDVHGRRPNGGETFTARYRVGNGAAGNVGAGAIAHAVTGDARIVGASNLLPAAGGREPETDEQVRRRAPRAFRTQERAVTPRDYAEVTERLDGVQRAAATPRWTGSWHTMFITVDRVGGEPLDAAAARDLRRHVERFRMAGHDLRFDDPVPVSLEIELLVCVSDRHFRADVRAGLLAVLGRHDLPDGRRGVFHPDRFSFGQTVYLSPVLAAARAVPGVESVQATRFHRQGQEDPRPLADGFLRLERLEIARLDNDPSFPEHGVLRLDLRGGK